MNLFKYPLFILFFSLISINLQAQEEEKTQSINEGSIQDQFEFVITKSGNYRDGNGQSYEVVKRDMMLTLQSHTIDSINAIQTKLDNTRNTVSTQKKEIDDLKNKLATNQDDLNASNTEKNSMSLFGMQMSKTSYNILMWAIITALFVFLLIFIYKFKNSNSVTKSAKSALTDVENEFEEHRRSALEREQKVRRQLQDELNKQKG